MPAPEIQRIVLIVALAVTGYLLMLAWQEDYGQAPAPTRSAPPVATEGPAETPAVPVVDPGIPVAEAPGDVPTDVPDIPLDAEPEPVGRLPEVVSDPSLVEVSTPTMTVWIDPRGGDLVGAHLPQYPVTLDRPDTPFVLLDRRAGHTYVAQSGLIGRDGFDARGERPLYAPDARTYRIDDAPQDVVLRFQDAGVSIEKRFRFDPEDYYVGLEYRVDNRSSEPFAANLFAQLKRDDTLPTGSQMFLGPRPYLGAALTTVESRYEKVDFEDLEEETLRETVDGGWIAILQHYFLSAWVADAEHAQRVLRLPEPARRRHLHRRLHRPRVLGRSRRDRNRRRGLLRGTEAPETPRGHRAEPGLDGGLRLPVVAGRTPLLPPRLDPRADRAELGRCHHPDDARDQARPLPAVGRQLQVDGENAQGGAADEAPAGAPRRRPATALPGDDGALQEGEGEPPWRLPADAPADAGVHRALLGALRERGAPPGAVLPLDRRPRLDGPVLRAAHPHGRLDVLPADAEPADAGPDAGAHHEDDAHHVHRALPLLPVRARALLARQQPAVHGAAVVHHLPHRTGGRGRRQGLARPGLTRRGALAGRPWEAT